ncbi:MAG: polysaccharide deacetylase family protein [Melioribacteraceae bacterium]
MNKLIFFLLISSFLVAQSKKEICITIDDLPFQQSGSCSTQIQKYYTDKLVGKLTAKKIPAVGFVNESKFEVDKKIDQGRVELLNVWLNSGLELGNHTYSHKGLHKSSVIEFTKDILNGEKHLRPLIERAGSELRYFRHPYLMTGRSLEIKDSVNTVLYKNGYTIAPVTVDNSEWIYAFAYQKAINSGDSVLMRRIADEYIPYMISKVFFYEKQSDKLFSRNIKHVLLMHANALNADYVDVLLSELSKNGYKFISLEEALKDPVYQLPDKYIGGAGISWIDRWALEKGMKKDFFAGEPRVSSWMAEYSGYEE